jgi:hypothetical protein
MRPGLRLAGLILLFACSARVPAQQPEAIRYPLTEREGPFLVYIASFRGDEALVYANNLAEELRGKHRLQAFVFQKADEAAKRDSDELKQEQLARIGTDPGEQATRKLRRVRVLEESAVFVGSFKDFEQARAVADRIKHFDPPSSIPQYGVHLYKNPTSRGSARNVDDEELGAFSSFSFSVKSVEGKRLRESQGNPYRQAFVARNPLLAQLVENRNAAPTFDPAWRELNAKEPHSIFSCPKPWTLVVAIFDPPAVIRSSLRSDVFSQNQAVGANGRGLEIAASNGRRLAEMLRDGGRGYDAYVFHTRQNTIVTVGAFDQRDEKMKQAWDILREFAAKQETGDFSCLLKFPRPMQIPGRN